MTIHIAMAVEATQESAMQLMWQFDTLFYLFFGALAISTVSTWFILKRVRSIGIDAPEAFRKWHDKPISRLGGLPIFLALSAGFLVLSIRQPEFVGHWLPIIISNAVVFSVGFLDDLKPLGARVKMAGQIGAALILYSLGVSIDLVSNPFGEGSLDLGWWSLPITVLWLIAIPNIVNLIDGMDGLATGFGMFLCITLAAVGYYAFKTDVVLMATVMAGALAGFLIFNFPPAKIFLGDGGAYLIGFFIASVSLMSSNKGSIMAGLLVVVIALGVPILDTSFAILRRAIRGVPIFSADAEHIHHRLILLGYSKQEALLALYIVCLILSLGGISILMTKGLATPIVGAIAFLLALMAARYLGYVRSWKMLRQQFREALERRRQLQYVQSHATLLEFEVERSESADEFSPILIASLQRIGIKPEPAQGWEPVELNLPALDRCILYCPQEAGSETIWRHRTEPFISVLTLARERWGRLPCLTWIESDASRPSNPQSSDSPKS